MNNEQIKTELRRSACEDQTVFSCAPFAFMEALDYKCDGEAILYRDDEAQRFFLLFVAEAL